jgi:hypothetical protein
MAQHFLISDNHVMPFGFHPGYNFQYDAEGKNLIADWNLDSPVIQHFSWSLD